MLCAGLQSCRLQQLQYIVILHLWILENVIEVYPSRLLYGWPIPHHIWYWCWMLTILFFAKSIKNSFKSANREYPICWSADICCMENCSNLSVNKCVEVHIGCGEGKLVSLCGLGQSSPHELTFLSWVLPRYRSRKN